MSAPNRSSATCCWCGSLLVKEQGAWWCGGPADVFEGEYAGSNACRRRQGVYAVEARAKKGAGQSLLYVPTPKQTVWHEAVYTRNLTRLLVGGAAGPGKSKWLREALYRLASQVPGFHALLLRKTHKDLDQSHLRFMPHELSQRGAQWKGTDRLAVFTHKGQADAIIRCGHLEDAGAIENYLSSEYDAIAPDELVTFERDAMLELFSRARSTNPKLFELRGFAHPDPEQELDGSLVLTATNPGGRGSLWVKQFFIDHNPDPEEFPNYEPQKWAFFDARLKDNPYIKGGYVKTLGDMRESRRRQLLEGDWNVFEGAFFAEFRTARHVRSLAIAPHVEFTGGMDWGYNSPGWMGWFAHLPDGHYHLVREYKFQGKSAEIVSADILRITRELGITNLRYIACDPAMKQKTGAGRGESIYETLRRKKLPMVTSDNDRFNGWQRVHELLSDAPDGTPWVTFEPSCHYLLRTLPALMQDKHNPDDVDTSGDDHGGDGVRYWAMKRPWPTRIDTSPKPYPVNSWGWWMEYHERNQRRGVLA